MDKRTIICISREYGSGGSEVAAKLAEMLGVPCYDKELVQKMDEKPWKYFFLKMI